MTPKKSDKPVAFITGGAGGIGSVTARSLARAGYHVVVSDIDLAGADRVVRDIAGDGNSAEAIELDASSRERIFMAIDGIVVRHGRIDLAVNNAGLQKFAAIEDIDERFVRQLVDLNFIGYVWVTQAAVRHIRAQGFGTIVNVASVAAYIGVAQSSIYSAIKGAIVAYTRTVAAELGPQGIRVNAVAPGSVQTAGSWGLHDEAAFERRRQRAALKRLCKPEEVADAIVWLASDKASYVTGQTILVDGGAVGSM